MRKKAAKVYHNGKDYASTPSQERDLEPRLQQVLQMFRASGRIERILDIGCGDGSFSLILNKALKAKEVYGIEISREGAQIASAKGVKVANIDIDVVDFPFPEAHSDAIWAGGIIEHLYDPDHLLEEAHRTLRSGDTRGIYE